MDNQQGRFQKPVSFNETSKQYLFDIRDYRLIGGKYPVDVKSSKRQGYYHNVIESHPKKYNRLSLWKLIYCFHKDVKYWETLKDKEPLYIDGNNSNYSLSNILIFDYKDKNIYRNQIYKVDNFKNIAPIESEYYATVDGLIIKKCTVESILEKPEVIYYIIPGFIREGYKRIEINGSVYTQHVLIQKAFIPPHQEGLVVHHINNNKQDNRLENLMWCTQKENVHFAIRDGLMPHCN